MTNTKLKFYLTLIGFPLLYVSLFAVFVGRLNSDPFSPGVAFICILLPLMQHGCRCTRYPRLYAILQPAILLLLISGTYAVIRMSFPVYPGTTDNWVLLFGLSTLGFVPALLLLHIVDVWGLRQWLKKEKGVKKLSKVRSRVISVASVVGFMILFQGLIVMLAILSEKNSKNGNGLAVLGIWTIELFVLALYIGIYHVLRRVCPSSVIVRSVFCGIHFVEYILFHLIFGKNIFHIAWINRMSFSELVLELGIFFVLVTWLILLAELVELIVVGIRRIDQKRKSRTEGEDHNDEQ